MSRLADWFRRAMGYEVRGDSDAIHCPEGAWVEPRGHDFSYPTHVPEELSLRASVCAVLGKPELIWPNEPTRPYVGQDPDAYRCRYPENRFLTRHGLTLDSKLSDAPQAKSREVPANLRLTPEARSAAVARGNRTRRLKKEMTEKLRSELQRSVDQA